MEHRIVVGNRRFTCLSPTLIRMEFAPDGVFEARRSFVAYAPQEPRAFQAVEERAGVLTLETGALTLISREHDRAFFPANLEVRWVQEGMLQYWRPGDRDHANLGGTVRSLDMYGSLAVPRGVHTADTASPDEKANVWISWLKCEDDPYYYAHSPEPHPRGGGDLFASVRYGLRTALRRTENHLADQLKFGPGLLSRSGYFLLNDSTSPLMDDDDFPVERNRPGYQDWYFFAYATDYAAALADFMRLAGRAPLPRKEAFGLMFCRWPAPDHAEAKEIVERFAAEGIPLSTLILDMEWHQEGWGNWDWNPETFPDPAGFVDWCHARGLAVALNDHPNDVRDNDSHFAAYLAAAGTADRVRAMEYNQKTVQAIDINIGNKREALAFLDVCHRPILESGIDFWWNDGCKGALNGTTNQLITNKLCFEEVQEGDRRGMLLARYGGVGSHRYGVFFTGDTASCWEVLRAQCEFNIRAGQIGMAYVSHDIGGFGTPLAMPLIDPALYVRWVQFGVFSPIFRFHSAPGSGSRLPWAYGAPCGEAAMRWLRVRNSLIPYVYTAARAHHDTGLPLVRGLYLAHPEDAAGYRFDEYFFGPSLLIAPMLSTDSYREVYLPAGGWYRFETNERRDGGQAFIASANLNNVPAYVKAGSILVRQDPDAPPTGAHVGHLLLDIYPGGDAEAALYEDDGRSLQYRRDGYCRTRFTLRETPEALMLAGEPVAGTPFGATRAITLEVSLDAPPSAAHFEKTTLAFEALPTPGRYRVTLPEVDAARRFEVRIAR